MKIIHGKKLKWIQLRMWLRITRIALSEIKNPIKAIRGVRNVVNAKKNLVSKRPLQKLVKIDNRYFWDLNQPGWPSESFDQNFRWMSRQHLLKETKHVESVRLVFLSITKRCPMRCEHCFEWDALNKKEVLTLESLKQIVKKYQDLGTASFVLGGGEPMARYNDLVELLKTAKPTSDFWITTSGYNVNEKRAKELKQAGLTGVSISIDKLDKAENNKFRGHQYATDFALNAAKNAFKAGLGVALALCATRDFITKENMFRYAEFAKELGAGFIWLIEPRAAGRYKGKDIQLKKEHFDILDEFFITLNNDKKYLNYPRVVFPNYNHRKIGCAGAGRRNVMIDTDGNINPCPFCRKEGIYALSRDSEQKVREMLQEGCFKFETRAS